ncbi:hypothetical protein A8709_02420 [Paenibacillus pectinilyticus]|uniref:Uncharacterized protein n=1 Tax=Paenibacillus pectinilyticus TaxID=512399 RepID=A0A1C1A6X1_9BACL|nr:hypothetical protein [Paenibacillus pectinilyticus]OCT16307.1 hypothetical protein A8709_02420 [Paenibacillus pectinilyticus]
MQDDKERIRSRAKPCGLSVLGVRFLVWARMVYIGGLAASKRCTLVKRLCMQRVEADTAPANMHDSV